MSDIGVNPVKELGTLTSNTSGSHPLSVDLLLLHSHSWILVIWVGIALIAFDLLQMRAIRHPEGARNDAEVNLLAKQSRATGPRLQKSDLNTPARALFQQQRNRRE